VSRALCSGAREKHYSRMVRGRSSQTKENPEDPGRDVRGYPRGCGRTTAPGSDEISHASGNAG
jgi:hypothetical protein